MPIPKVITPYEKWLEKIVETGYYAYLSDSFEDPLTYGDPRNYEFPKGVYHTVDWNWHLIEAYITSNIPLFELDWQNDRDDEDGRIVKADAVSINKYNELVSAHCKKHGSPDPRNKEEYEASAESWATLRDFAHEVEAKYMPSHIVYNIPNIFNAKTEQDIPEVFKQYIADAVWHSDVSVYDASVSKAKYVVGKGRIYITLPIDDDVMKYMVGTRQDEELVLKTSKTYE